MRTIPIWKYVVNLSQLRKGQVAQVLGIQSQGPLDSIAQRLLDLGFVVGEQVRFFAEKMQCAEQAGLPREAIILASIVEKAKAALDAVYGWLDKELASGGWATADGFTLADCAAARCGRDGLALQGEGSAEMTEKALVRARHR